MSKLSFKRGTAAYKKRKEITHAILRENPGIDEGKKFAIATAATKKAFAKKGRK